MAHRSRARRVVRSAMAALAVGGATLALAAPGQAAFPGANGRIAYDYDQHRSIDGNAPTSTSSREIWAEDPDGTARVQLTSNLASDTDPTWSPDGRWIAFTSDRTGIDQIWLMRADGSEQRQVTHAPAGARQPAWSPGGYWLVYAEGGDLWTVSALGILARPLTRTPDVTESAPAWSPTGLRIAYTAAPASAPPERQTSIWTIRIDGREARNLTAVTGTATSEDARPDWSPDGTRILFDTNRGPSRTVDGLEVWVMRTDGTSPSVMVTSSGRTGELGAVYSPDGRQVADQGCGFGLCLIGLDVLGADGAPATLGFQIGGDPTDDDVELANPSWQPVGLRVGAPSVVRPIGYPVSPPAASPR